MLKKETALELYYKLLRIRIVEEKIAELYLQQEMRCPVHLCTGQEAIAVGVCAHLKQEDYVMSSHRGHGHYLAKGGSLKSMMAEIYGRSTGCSKGKGGSMHLTDLNENFLGSTPIVGGIIPVAAGVAFGIAMNGMDRLAVVFFGDAATEEGVFCESLNFAALKKLPIIFVCENNFFSVYSSLNVRQPKERNNLALARAYGVRAAKGDGNDILGIYRLAKKAVSEIRKGSGPYYLEFDTYRWREHCGPDYDNHLGYRDESEFLKWRSRCPVENYETRMIKEGIIDEEQIKELKSKIVSEFEEAVVFAKNSPFPGAEDIFTEVYA